MTDPNGNAAGYSYSNQDAYLAQITYPQTNGINHIESFGYDPDSGLAQTFLCRSALRLANVADGR
jgi:hypothetical protein